MPKISADRLDGTLASECRTLFVDASCQCYSQEGRSFRLEMRSLPRGDVVWCPVDALVPFRLSLSRPSSSLALLQNRFPPSRPIIFRHVTHVLLSALRTRTNSLNFVLKRGRRAVNTSTQLQIGFDRRRRASASRSFPPSLPLRTALLLLSWASRGHEQAAC